MAKQKILDYDGLSFLISKIQEQMSECKEVVLCEDELEIKSIASPRENVLYVVLSPLSIYVYNDGWECATSQEEISEDFIDELFVGDEEGNLLNNITAISDAEIDEIWNSI